MGKGIGDYLTINNTLVFVVWELITELLENRDYDSLWSYEATCQV